jgi:hypothetical protein
MGTAFLVIGNESDWTSPSACRATLKDCRGDESDDYVCPSTPEGMEHLLKIMREEFAWFRQFDPEYLAINPYDPGGCGCDKCAPWLTNGFLKCSEAVAHLAKAEMPGIKTILFTSLVINRAGEWQSLAERLRTKPDWCDYVMTEKLTGDSVYGAGPAPRSRVSLPALGFPDISMLNTSPWGGRGAATLPTYFEARWRERAPLLDGGFPYSEGIFEDMSKVLYAQFYWQPDRPAEDILAEYIAFEFSPDVVDEVIPAIRIMEQNNGRNTIRHGAASAFANIKKAESKLTPRAAQAWRWRLVALRAKIDNEKFLRDAALKPAFDELRDIYHARNANGCVRPAEIIIADEPSFLPDRWHVLGPVDRSFTLTPQQLKTMPKCVESSGGKITLREVKASRGQLDLATCLSGTAEYRTAYVFVPFELDSDREVTFGFGADWWFEAFVDGSPVCDSLPNGNGQFPFSAWDHMRTVRLDRGEHLLAIRFVSGNSSSFLCAGAF